MALSHARTKFLVVNVLAASPQQQKAWCDDGVIRPHFVRELCTLLLQTPPARVRPSATHEARPNWSKSPARPPVLLGIIRRPTVIRMA